MAGTVDEARRAPRLLAEKEGGADVFSADCPSRRLLDHVTGRWGILVLVALEGSPLRWTELRQELSGVTDKMLTQTLKALESDGLVWRTAQPGFPPRVAYGLTEAGSECAVRLKAVVDWVVAYTEHGQ